MASVIRHVQKFKNISLRLPTELAERVEGIRDAMKSLPDMEFPLEELLQPQIAKLVSQCEEEIAAHLPTLGSMGASSGNPRGRGRRQEQAMRPTIDNED